MVLLTLRNHYIQNTRYILVQITIPKVSAYSLETFFFFAKTAGCAFLEVGFLAVTATFLVRAFSALPPVFFTFLAAALAALPMRAFSSADTLKLPDPFLPGWAPGTSTPSSRIFFRVLFRRPACLATSM